MYDTGSTAFMLVCAMLVLLMTPGLAFFYGGLSRRKNVVNTMIMVFSAIGIVAITWTICGWSLAYGGDGSSPFFGGFDQLGFLGGVTDIFRRGRDGSRGYDVSHHHQLHLPDGVLHDHHRHYHGLSCRPYEVRSGVHIRGSVDHRGVPAGSPIWFGVVMAALSATPSARSTSQAAMSCTSPLV